MPLFESQEHPGWKSGEIRRLDNKSGQVLVAYEYDDREPFYGGEEPLMSTDMQNTRM